MNMNKITLHAVFFLLLALLLSIAVGIGWYYKNPVFLGPYQITGWDRPVYIEFPIIEDSFDNPSQDLFIDFNGIKSFDKVMLLDIDPVDLLREKPYPLSKSFPDPRSMKLSALAWGPIKKTDILNLGPKGDVDLKYLAQMGIIEDVSPDEVKIVGRKFNQHDVRLNQIREEYYAPTKEVLIKSFFSTPFDEIQKIIESQPGHPHYVSNRAQFGFYRFIGGVVNLYTYNEVIWALVGLAFLVVLWWFKLPAPLMYWWCIQAVYGLAWRGLTQYRVLSWAHLRGRFWEIFPAPAPGMFHYPCYGTGLSHFVCTVLFFFIVPIVFVYMSWIFVTKHLIPKQKRLVEDFFKFDKDKEKKQDMDISEIQFKKVEFDMPQKLEEYKTKDEFFLGVDDDGRDVSVPVSLANENFWCIGPIGSGKTATMIMPLAMQSLDKGYGACFIDLKEDKALIRAVREKCKEKGKKFYYVSINDEDKSENYNPLSSGGIPSKVDRIMSALKLDMPGAAAYYSGEQSTAFMAVLDDLDRRIRKINLTNVLASLNDSDYLVSIGVNPKDVRGLISAIGNIEAYPMINEDGINLKQIMDEQSVVYFNLPPSINSKVAAAIGRMILVDFKYWSARRNEHMPRFFIFIDEFQILASESFVEIISQVRKAQYCLVLANQSLGNLSVVSPSFQQVVMDCTQVKVIFRQFQDAPFWSARTGTNRVDEPMMRMESGEMFDEDKTSLDGKRIRDGVVSKISKPKYTENTFLNLPKNKSVIFIPGKAVLTNHGYCQSREWYDKVIAEPVGYEGGVFYGDPHAYNRKQEEKEVVIASNEIEKVNELERIKRDLESTIKEVEKLKKEKEDMANFSNDQSAKVVSNGAAKETAVDQQLPVVVPPAVSSVEPVKAGETDKVETNESVEVKKTTKKGAKNEGVKSKIDFVGGMDSNRK